MVKAAASINLTREEAIVLIEFLLRFCDEQRLSVEHQAEEKLLWNLGCVLEEQVPELFLPEWKSIVEQSRAAVLAEEGEEPEDERDA